MEKLAYEGRSSVSSGRPPMRTSPGAGVVLRADLLAEGAQVGSFRLVKLLGTGGMGSVYLGEHVDIGKRAAIKVLRPELAKQADSVTRFLREARLVSKLKHPSIVEIFDCGFDPEIGRYI